MLAVNPFGLVVPTKLRPPQKLEVWVERTRLFPSVEALPDAKLVLVVAPTGFGKSTLVAQWLAHQEAQAKRDGHARSRFAWVTLDEYDQASERFLALVAGAIEEAIEQPLTTIRDLFTAPKLPPPYVLLQALLVDLNALTDQVTLVLDDYHMLTSEPIHQAVAYFVRHLPALCRLVVISRTDPPLSLARLRAEQQLVELRADALRFTPAETRALLTNLQGSPPPSTYVDALQEQTEGWALAVQMAALAWRDSMAPAQSFALATRQIAEYLADEVLVRQPAEIQQTLLVLAIPERFCASLCAALLGKPEAIYAAEGRLQTLLCTNLFVIPLDEAHQWYRFHHLFRDLLVRYAQSEFDETQLALLNQRAADWFYAHGLNEEALRHLLAAGNEDGAARLIEQLLMPTMGQDVLPTSPDYWLQRLPSHVIDRRPGLILIAARLAVFKRDMWQLQRHLAQIDQLLAPPGTHDPLSSTERFQADLAALRGILALWEGDATEAIRSFEVALKLGPTPALGTQVLLALGLAYAGADRFAEGVALLEADLPATLAALRPQQPLCRATGLCWMAHLIGDLAAQQDYAQQLYDFVVTNQSSDFWLGYAAYSLGMVAYERNDLAAAQAQFQMLARRKYKVSYPGYSNGVIGLALIALARGSLAEAEVFAQEALVFANEVGGVFLRHQALSCAVQVALARGDVPSALCSAAGIDVDHLHPGFMLSISIPCLSKVQALVAAGDLVNLRQADLLLASWLAQVAQVPQTRLQISGLAMQAVVRHAQGQTEQALTLLDQALQRASAAGFVRTLLDLGSCLRPLLDALREQSLARPYLQQLLTTNGSHPDETRPASPVLARGSLPELLTTREAEILGLLALRWSDKEIARHLVIAPNTVRKHTTTIYDKLGVHSRREAVMTAHALGLLAPEAPATR
ncbi:LuxR C-terminal-related transcriptional regulator [Candidatus Chloroploca sp. Khr17]|uniref:LuxR C-terminal-related transcriptional regulator n=1 Tax=Candidatus Chloroploca sp. Khr17 TaxID=2496869 RepID=UPI00101C8CFC|nr:LuxR C-terminal-related transcriptional regulator [Candidatus Chloroploca sp. Khr17]